MNTTTLYGRLTADPELQTASNGNEFVRFTLAVDRRLSRKTREEHKDDPNFQKADFLPCVAWKGTAHLLSIHCKKGSPINVKGRLESSTYTNKQGERRYSVEVRVDEVDLLSFANSSKNTANTAPAKSAEPPVAPSAQDIEDEEIPF